jgi:hypothetical protein
MPGGGFQRERGHTRPVGAYLKENDMTTTLNHRPQTVSHVRTLGRVGLAGGVMTIAATIIDPTIGLGDTSSWDGFFVVEGLAVALSIASVLGLLRSDVPANVATRLALRAAAIGLAVFAAGHLLAGFNPASEDTPLMPVGGMFSTVGMLVAAVLVLRSGRWAGPDRFTPLACGLYPVLVLIPAFVVFGDGNMAAIAGFGLVWALFGLGVTRLGER